MDDASRPWWKNNPEIEAARDRYAKAIRAARTAGWSWGEIGRVLGVPRQLLHRRFRDGVD